jgi:hypothetical protein
MKTIQELVTSLLPQKWAEDIEADSRAWMMQCTFGNKVSVWEAGNPWRLLCCPACGERTMHRLYKSEQP